MRLACKSFPSRCVKRRESFLRITLICCLAFLLDRFPVSFRGIVATQDHRGLQQKLLSDHFFLSYIFGCSLFNGDPPPLEPWLKLKLAPMMMETFGSREGQYRSVFDAPLRAQFLLDPEHYSVADGIIFGLDCGHPLAPYKAFRLASELEEYRNYDYRGRFSPWRRHLVNAVKSGLVQPTSLRNHECFTVAEYLMSPAVEEDNVAVESADSNVRGSTLLIHNNGGGGGQKEMQAGDFLSIVASRGKDEEFWRRMLACFYRNDQVIRLEGRELSDVTPHIALGTKSNGREDYLLNKAVECLNDNHLSLSERAEQAMLFFRQAITTMDGIDLSLKPCTRRQLWAVAMRTLAANGSTFVSARGDIDFVQAFLVFLLGAEREDYYFWSPDYKVDGKRFTSSQDANAVRCLALSKLTNWVDGVDVEVKCLGDSLIFDTTNSFRYLIRYPEGRSLIWKKEFVDQWVYYCCSAIGLKALPSRIFKRIYNNDGLADASQVLVTREQYFRLVDQLDPGNEKVRIAMELLEANPSCTRLIKVSQELAATVKAQTKISNIVGEVNSSQTDRELMELSPENAAALKETLIFIEGVEKTIKVELSENDAAALQVAMDSVKDAEKLAKGKVAKLALRGMVGEALEDLLPQGDGRKQVVVRTADLPEITPAELDQCSSFTITEHPDVEAFLKDEKNTTTFGPAKAVAALCCVIL